MYEVSVSFLHLSAAAAAASCVDSHATQEGAAFRTAGYIYIHKKKTQFSQAVFPKIHRFKLELSWLVSRVELHSN